MSTRRAILKIIGGLPAGVAAAKGEVAAMLASPAVASAAALAAAAVPADSTIPLAGNGFYRSIIGKQLKKLTDGGEAESFIRRGVRVSGLDPDLVALRSMAYGHRARIQIERDIEDATLFAQARGMLYGD